MTDMEDLAEELHPQIPSTLTPRCIGSSFSINVELESRNRMSSTREGAKRMLIY
jgi:hypothetical protein